MSCWTYVHGTVTVRPIGSTQEEKEYILKTVLNHLPVVSGSEKDMNVYVIQKKGHNTSQSCDEFGEVTNNLTDSYGDRSYKNGWLRIQDEYILVVDASLRDREFDETYKEFQKWLCRLAKRVIIKDVLVEVSAYEKSIVIKNPYIQGKRSWKTLYGQMFEELTWCRNKTGKPNWCEFMLYDKAKKSNYPMLLAYKYFHDEENDKEVERRLEYQKRK